MISGGSAGAPRTLIVIGGPTASGKTRVAATIAKHYGTEVISADSRQFYRAMPIGTAQPDVDDMQGVKHHFIGHLDVDRAMSAGSFARAAEPPLQELLERHGIVVMVGGSGLYIDAVIRGLDQLPPADPRVRATLQQRLEAEGLPALVAELRALDPEHGRSIDHRNPHRVLRALEVCLVTGRPFSAQRSGKPIRTDMQVLRLALDVRREVLYERIDARVDRMMRDGLAEEARALLPFRAHNAVRTVGYRELFEHFDGRTSLDQAVSDIKQHTRHYARRQMTWLRRDREWTWLPPDPNPIIQHIDRHG